MLAPPLYTERLTLASNSVKSAVEQLCASSSVPADPAWLEQHSAKCLLQPIDSAVPTGPSGAAAASSSGGRPSASASAPPVVRCIASVCFETIAQLDLKISRATHPNAAPYIGTLAPAPTPWRLPQLQNAANLLHEALLALDLLRERARRLTTDSTRITSSNDAAAVMIGASVAPRSAATSSSSPVGVGPLAAAAPFSPAKTGQSQAHQTMSSSNTNPKLQQQLILPLLPTLYHRPLLQEALSKLQLARRTLECPTRRSVAELLALRRDHPLSPPLPSDLALSLFVDGTRVCLALYLLAQVGAAPATGRLEIVHLQVLESALPSLLVVLPRLRAVIRLLEQLSCETL